MRRRVIALIALFVCSLISFFIGALTNPPFTTYGDNAWYASELICGTDSTNPLCSDKSSNEIPLFRGNAQEDTTQYFRGATYHSANFALFVQGFYALQDTYREVILKIFAIKSLLISVAILSVALLVIAYPYLKPTVGRTVTVMFSLPFILETGAGFYPGGIASIALLPCLLILVVVQKESIIATSRQLLLATVFLIFSMIVISNRFETTIFLILACGLAVTRLLFCRSLLKGKGRLLISLLVIGVLLAGAATLFNPASGRLFNQAAKREIQIVFPDTPSRSVETIEKIGLPGDFAFSLMAPVTMIDNSTRFFLSRTYQALFQDRDGNSTFSTFHLFVYAVVTVLAWLPMIVVVGSIFYPLAQKILPVLRRRKRFEVNDVSLMFLLLLYFFIPFYARLVWSYWYLVPLLMLVTTTAANKPLSKVERLALLICWLSSVLSLIAVNWRLGDLYIGGFVFARELMTGCVVALTCGVFVAFNVSTRRDPNAAA